MIFDRLFIKSGEKTSNGKASILEVGAASFFGPLNHLKSINSSVTIVDPKANEVVKNAVKHMKQGDIDGALKFIIERYEPVKDKNAAKEELERLWHESESGLKRLQLVNDTLQGFAEKNVGKKRFDMVNIHFPSPLLMSPYTMIRSSLGILAPTGVIDFVTENEDVFWNLQEAVVVLKDEGEEISHESIRTRENYGEFYDFVFDPHRYPRWQTKIKRKI